jgi:hypothetical protein
MGVGPARHVLADGGLTDLDTELEQLPVDPRRTQSGLATAELSREGGRL